MPAGVSGFFIDIKFLPIALWPWGRLSLQQKFPGGKGCRCIRLTTLPPSCAVVTKSGNLDFLEPSGPVQACNGTALPFTAINNTDMTTVRTSGLTATLATLSVTFW